MSDRSMAKLKFFFCVVWTAVAGMEIAASGDVGGNMFRSRKGEGRASVRWPMNQR